MTVSDRVVRRRAYVDAGASVIASFCVGLVLVLMFPASTLAGWGAVATGVLVVGGAALSIVGRTPVRCTPADRVTLARCVLVGTCATVIILSLFGAVPVRSWLLTVIAVPALLLDAVDGWVARRTGTASADGARFDMFVDSTLLVVLSVPAAVLVGPWVLAIPAMLYLFRAAAWWRPALRGPLKSSNFRRLVGGFQGAALVLALAPVIPLPAAVAALAVALLLLIVSFGRDVVALEREG